VVKFFNLTLEQGCQYDLHSYVSTCYVYTAQLFSCLCLVFFKFMLSNAISLHFLHCIAFLSQVWVFHETRKVYFFGEETRPSWLYMWTKKNQNIVSFILHWLFNIHSYFSNKYTKKIWKQFFGQMKSFSVPYRSIQYNLALEIPVLQGKKITNVLISLLIRWRVSSPKKYTFLCYTFIVGTFREMWWTYVRIERSDNKVVSMTCTLMLALVMFTLHSCFLVCV
jgi:hypothetical protein